MAASPEPRPAESAEDAHAVAAVARALAEELQKQKQRTKEAELRASAARTAEVKAKSELAKQRAGWKQRKQKWLAYKAKHEALKAKYSRLLAIVRKERTARSERAAASTPTPAPAAAPLPPAKNGGSTPASQPVRARAPSTRKPPAAEKASLLKKPAAAAQSAPACLPPVAASLPPATAPLPPPAAAPNAARGERRKRSAPQRGLGKTSPAPSSPAQPKAPPPPPPQPPVHHEVVRSKAARAKMDAITCPQCRGFFAAAGGVMSKEAIEACHRECSRHRVSKAAATVPHETPESFWRIGFTDESEQQRPASSGLFDPFAFDELAPHQGGDAKRQRLATRTFSRKAR